jgi:O-antigen/teichoic acid export membrane protein
MSVLSRNIIANALGQSVGVLSGLLLMPLYARYLGREGFGLIGFFLSLQAIAAVFDLGLGAAANREVSRLSAVQQEPGAGRHVVRTLEWLYLVMGLVVAGAFGAASGWIATDWIRAEDLPVSVVRDCVLIAAITIGLRLLCSLYYGVMRGLERQVRMNLFSSAIAGVQTLGLAAILIWIRPSILAFIGCQLAFAVLEIATLRQLVWRECRVFGGTAAAFRFDVVRGIWRFALSVNGISLFAAGIKQVDKIVISKLLSIGNLGYYSAASLAANGLGKIAVPFQTALFPRFSHLFAKHQHDELSRLFRHSVRLLSCITCAVAAAFVFFAHDILRLWLGSTEAADSAAVPMSVLSAAMMLNGVMAPVFSMILASGYTRISLTMNAAGLAALVPATLWLVDQRGLTGAAVAWLGFNLAYYLIVPTMLARRWRGFSLAPFYLQDSLPFIATSLLVCASCDWLAHGQTAIVRLVVAVLAGGLSLLAGITISLPLREFALTTWRTRRA